MPRQLILRIEYDEAVVVRVIGGEHGLSMTRADRLEIVRRLSARGLSLREVGAVVGKAPRQISRDKLAAVQPPRPRKRPEPRRRSTPARDRPTCTGYACSTCTARARRYQAS